jgi:hypothetical protein
VVAEAVFLQLHKISIFMVCKCPTWWVKLSARRCTKPSYSWFASPHVVAEAVFLQVHKAIMIVGGKRRSVVVKVRHPGVEVRIKQDFQILKPLAAAASKVICQVQVYQMHNGIYRRSSISGTTFSGKSF